MSYPIDREAEQKYLTRLHQLDCRDDHCRVKLGMPSSDANVERLTPDGVRPPVYLIGCPRNFGDEYCAYGATVVFLPPNVWDREKVALQIAVSLFETRCLICQDEEINWKRARKERTFADEVQLLVPCTRNPGNLSTHTVRWVGEDSEVPSQVPLEWLKLVRP